jgi:hypothetical protein
LPSEADEDFASNGGKLEAKSKGKSNSIGNLSDGKAGLNNSKHDFASLTKLGDELLRSVDNIKKILGDGSEEQSTPSRKPSSKIPVSSSPSAKQAPALSNTTTNPSSTSSTEKPVGKTEKAKLSDTDDAEDMPLIRKVSLMLEKQLPNLNSPTSSLNNLSSSSVSVSNAASVKRLENASLSSSASSSSQSASKSLAGEGLKSKNGLTSNEGPTTSSISHSTSSTGFASSSTTTGSPSVKTSVSYFHSSAPKMVSIGEMPLLPASTLNNVVETSSVITPSMILSQQASKSSIGEASPRESSESKIPRSRRLSAGKYTNNNHNAGDTSVGTGAKGGGVADTTTVGGNVGIKGSVAARRRSLDRRTKEAASGLFITPPTASSPVDGPLSPGGDSTTPTSMSRRSSIINKPRTRLEVQKGDFSWMKAPSYSSSTGNISEILIPAASHGEGGVVGGRRNYSHQHHHHISHSHSSNTGFSAGPISTADNSNTSEGGGGGAGGGSVKSRLQNFAKQSSAPVIPSFSKSGSSPGTPAAPLLIERSSHLKNSSIRASSNNSLNASMDEGKPHATLSPHNINNESNAVSVGIKERIKSFENILTSDPASSVSAPAATLSRSKSSNRGDNRK